MQATENATQTCRCGLVTPAADGLTDSLTVGPTAGPSHPYILSTPTCWAAYCALLAREYEDPARWRTHRLSVDAYSVQHPGVDTPKARNSVGVHLSRLHLIFERGWPLERANQAMLLITAKKFDFPWLVPPADAGGLTCRTVLAAEGPEAHMREVERWAAACWAAWSQHHATVREWLRHIP